MIKVNFNIEKSKVMVFSEDINHLFRIYSYISDRKSKIYSFQIELIEKYCNNDKELSLFYSDNIPEFSKIQKCA